MKALEIELALRQLAPDLPPDPSPETSRGALERIPGIQTDDCKPDVKLSNVVVDGAEADLLLVSSRTGVIEEFEIKVSRGDFLRESIIARSARQQDDLKIRESDRAKYLKHARFESRTAKLPNYYSFAVPESLRETALENAPPYAGIIVIKRGAVETLHSLERARHPQLLSRQKADAIFFADASKHLSNQYANVCQLAASVRRSHSKYHESFLKNIAKALTEVELKLKEKGAWSPEAVEFLIHRAVSGMSQHEKDSVRRFFLTSQWRELDLFDS